MRSIRTQCGLRVLAMAIVPALGSVLIAPSLARAAITEIRITAVRPFAEGAPQGPAGPYERVTGVARGELDPADPRNRVIVNLDLAPRNARGKVEYEADFDLLRPVGGGNRKLIYDVTNRGRKFFTHWVMDGAPANANDPLSREDAGNALHLRQGYTLVWSGWDPDAPLRNKGMSIRVPVAMRDGQPIVRRIRDEFQSGTRGPVVGEFRLSYESATTDQGRATLTVRRAEGDPRVAVPPTEWRFKDARTLQVTTPGSAGSGPAVGSVYELHYPARNPWVLGVGYAATRDLVSFLRYASADSRGTPNPAGPGVRHALAIGISQSGRYLRDHISDGFNRDESDRKVFDGVLAHISGVGRVFMNAEFGQPFRTNTQHEDHLYPENSFPFSAARSTDPVTGTSGALLRGDGFDPLLIEVNTATEYWQKGASLLHTDPAGTRDLELPPGARVYLVAGTQHGGRVGLTPARGPCNQERNPHSPAPALRALLAALDAWVDKGVAPPPSRVPNLREGTLVKPDNAGFPAIPGWQVARRANPIVLFGDWVDPRPDPARGYPALVARTDADGNEVAGIRLPDIAVPLATHTGWNLYRRPYPEGELCDRDGSYAPFALTRAQREQAGDPRLSVQERYEGPQDYLRRVADHVSALQADRLLLPEDAAAYLERAKVLARQAFDPR